MMKMDLVKRVLLMSVLVVVSGCANWERNTYEGIREQQSVPKPGTDKPATSLPDYDTYQKEFKKAQPGKQ
jgi:hypothetical protein